MGIYEKLQYLDHERTLQRLVEKLPNALKGRWCDQASQYWETHRCHLRFADPIKFVKKVAAAANNPYYRKKALRDLQTGNASNNQKSQVQSPSFATNVTEREKTCCSYCAIEEHQNEIGNDLAKIKLDERRMVIIGKGLCWGYLKIGHRASMCKNQVTCNICK